jgi:hypothetical protein
MTDIVAGRFQQQGDAKSAVERFLRHGFRRDDVNSFFVSPPGQHGKFAVGGDRNVSAETPPSERRDLLLGRGVRQTRPWQRHDRLQAAVLMIAQAHVAVMGARDVPGDAQSEPGAARLAIA